MAKSSSEVKGLVSEVEEPFLASDGPDGKGVRDRIRTIRDVVFSRFNYSVELSPYLRNKISVPADNLRTYKDQGTAALRVDLRLHLDPIGNQRRQETAADKVEVMEAYQLMRLDADGNVREDIHYYQVIGLFYAGWLDEEPYLEPEQAKGESNKDFAKRAEQYRTTFFPWCFRTLNPEAVAWMERDRKVTAAVQHFRLPVIDLLERYGRDYKVRRENPEQALRIFNQHFGFLRGDESRPWHDEGQLFSKDIEVCVFADNAKICHYADLHPIADGDKRLLKSERNEQYYGLGAEEYDNHFGQNPLLLAEGVYNPFEDLPYRREGILTAAIGIEHAKARLKSHWASEAANPPLMWKKLPKEAGDEETRDPAPAAMLLDREGQPMLEVTTADFMQMERQVDANMDKLFSILSEEGKLASPRTQLFDPQTMQDARVNVVLPAIDEMNRLKAGAQQSECRLWAGILDRIRFMQTHFQQENLAGDEREKGSPKRASDQTYALTTTGKEVKVRGREIPRGERFEITPQDLDQEFVRTLEPYDNSIATTMQRGQWADQRWTTGSILWDERIEAHGVENVTEFNKKKTEEQLFQVEAPRFVMDVRMRVAQFTALINGTSVEEVLGGLPEEVVPQIVGASQPGQVQPVQRYGSPVQEAPAAQNGVRAAV